MDDSQLNFMAEFISSMVQSQLNPLMFKSFLIFSGIGASLDQNTFNDATLRMLKSIKKVEENEHFKNFSWPVYDRSYLTYEEKLVVAQPGYRAPKPFPGERRFTSVEEAIAFCIWSNKEFGTSQFSILVHEGTYFNPIPEMIKGTIKDLSLEIIGTKNVRFILCNPFSKLITIYSGRKVTFKNIWFYSRTVKGGEPVVGAEKGGCCSLQHLAIHAPESWALQSWGEGSTMSISDSVVLRCFRHFSISHAEMYVSNCICYGGSRNSFGTLNFTNTQFFYEKQGYKQVAIFKGTSQFKGCSFRGTEVPGNLPAICANQESSVTVVDCCFSDFYTAVTGLNTGTEVVMERCRVDKNVVVAADCRLNASFKVFDSHLDSEFFLSILDNKKGKVVFKRNKVKQQPEIYHDGQSIVPDIDIVDYEIQLGSSDYEAFVPTMKEMSAYGNKFKNYYPSDLRELHVKAIKSCAHCLGENSPSMKYCDRCKRVAYCNKECQRADWPDHKFICRSFKTLKT